MNKRLSSKAFSELKNGNTENALKLYQELKMTLSSNAFDYNIHACSSKVFTDGEIGELLYTAYGESQKAIESTVRIETKSVVEYHSEIVEQLDSSEYSILIYVASKMDMPDSDVRKVVSAAKRKKCKTVLLLDMQPIDLKRVTRENELFDEVYVRPFEATDQFWINFILNCNEFEYAVALNSKKLKEAAELTVGVIEWADDSASFAFSSESLYANHYSSALLKEYAGFLLPFEDKYSCYEYFERLRSFDLISHESFFKITRCTKFEDCDTLSLDVLKQWIESGHRDKNAGIYRRAIENPINYKYLPDTILGGAREVADFYVQESKKKVNLFCFREYLERGGIAGRIKNDDILAIDGTKNFAVMPLSNYKDSLAQASIHDGQGSLHYVDLLPLRIHEVTDIEELKSSGRIPVPTTVPVIRRLDKSVYNIDAWTMPDDEARFGMISACFNDSKTLISSLMSVLGQSVKNLELIIVDDNSNDGSLELISGFLSLFPYVSSKIVSKEENAGVYSCRNAAIIESSSEFLFGQDLDDYSSSQRVYMSNLFYRSKHVDFLVCNHARVDSQFNILSMKKGDDPLKTFRKGLVTWHIERANFFKYGMFLSVRKGGDSEFFDRLKRLSDNGVFELDQNFYYALMDDRNKSRLTSDIFKISLNSSPVVYQFQGSDSRFQFEKTYKEIHKNSGLRFNFRFGRNLEDESVKIVANMATIPGREHELAQSVDSILFQVDRLNLFANGDVDFSQGEISKLIQNDKIRVYESEVIGDLRDNAKFFAANEMSGKCFYLTLDDDLSYPVDYVDTLLYKSHLYGNASVLTVHGYKLWPSVQSIHTDKDKRGRYYHFKERLDRDVRVDVAGTGTVFIPPGVAIRGFNEPPFGMVDMIFANYCSDNDVDIIAVGREQNWVTSAKKGQSVSPTSSAPLFVENQNAEREAVIRSYVEKIQRTSVIVDLPTKQSEEFKTRTSKIYYNNKSDHLSLGALNRKVYICCTGYNYSKYARQFGRSLWNALRSTSFDDVTILAYDDCSTDDSQCILRKYFDTNMTAWSWEIFDGERNMGPAYARSFLFDQICEEDAICIFLDLDDEVEPDLICRILLEYACDPTTLGTFGGWKFNDAIRKSWPSHAQSELTSLDDIAGKFKFGSPRSFVKSVYSNADRTFLFGPDGQWLRYCSDLGLYLAVLSRADLSKFKRVDEILYKYNVGTENGTIGLFGSRKAVMRDYLFGKFQAGKVISDYATH